MKRSTVTIVLVLLGAIPVAIGAIAVLVTLLVYLVTGIGRRNPKG